MRILAFADTHGELDFSHLDELAKQADIIVCAGDVTFFGEELEKTFSALETFATRVNKKILFIHGNHETGEDIPQSPHIIHLHENTYEHDGTIILGYGGGGFGKNDLRAEKFLSEHAKKYADKKQVWVFHGPPYDLVVDVVPEVGPTGCMSKRKMIENHKPHIVIAGHIHDQWGTIHDHDGIIVVNPGPSGRLLEL